MIQIHKLSRFGSASVQRWNGSKFELALNWYELSVEAMKAIEPEARRRWIDYWNANAARASVAVVSNDVNEMMERIQAPSPYYDCPPELARRAVWSTSQPNTLMVVDAGN